MFYGSTYILFFGLLGGVLLAAVYFHQPDPDAEKQLAAGQSATEKATFETAFGSLPVEGFKATKEELEPILIDIRTAEEYNQGHLPGAINIDYYQPAFKQALAELDPDQAYAIYCRSGRRSLSALELMKERGFDQVIELAGGLEAWAEAGQKVCLDC